MKSATVLATTLIASLGLSATPVSAELEDDVLSNRSVTEV